MSEAKSAIFNADEHKTVVDALITYGGSIVAILESQPSARQPEVRAVLLRALERTKAIVTKLGAKTPPELEFPPAQEPHSTALH
jgi:hypothetical protein